MLPILEKMTIYRKNKLKVFWKGAKYFHWLCIEDLRKNSLNIVIAEWKEEIKRNKRVVPVLLDLKRSFETIAKKRLIEKPIRYGRNKKALLWIRHYLTDRF